MLADTLSRLWEAQVAVCQQGCCRCHEAQPHPSELTVHGGLRQNHGFRALGTSPQTASPECLPGGPVLVTVMISADEEGGGAGGHGSPQAAPNWFTG